MTAIFEQVVKLKYRHWQTTTFVDAQDVYDQIAGKKVAASVWIIDLMMPKKSGIEIAQAIRDSGQADAVLIAYTALDPQTLARSPEYRDGLHLFEKVIGKQDGFMKIMAGIELTYLRQVKA
jgi:CheY-like chemotaxis protein